MGRKINIVEANKKFLVLVKTSDLLASDAPVRYITEL